NCTTMCAWSSDEKGVAITGAFDNDCILSRCIQKGLPELSRFCQNGVRQYVACLFLWWQQFERRLLRCTSSVSCRARKDVISARRSPTDDHASVTGTQP